MMRRTLSAIVVSLTTVISVPLGSSAAFAAHGSNVFVNTTNGSGQTQFYHSGEHLYACDTAADGLRAVAIVQWSGGSVEVQDADGANGNCAGYVDLNIIDHTAVRIWACVRNGATGAPQYCSYADAFA